MPDESEWQTRKQRIDARLKKLGWKILPFSNALDLGALDKIAVEELPTANGPADYGLFVGGKLLGIIEAKKVTVNPQNVLEQAKRYAAGVFAAVGEWDGLRVPFLYASNGTIIWHLDTRPAKRVSRPISDFHTPDALAGRFNENTQPAHDWLLATAPEQIGRLRPYQRGCIVAVESAIVGGKRDLMVAMATGTGKTFLTVAQIYRLLESKLVRRILFLVDRKALAAQAVREFSAFNTSKGNKFTQEYEVYSQRFQREDFGDDEPFNPNVLPNEYLTAPKPSHTFVYVSTIQRMARNLFGAQGAFAQTGGDGEGEDDADALDIRIDAFDLIIADECHRGYTAQETSIWRDTLQHFDAIRMGLTATPAAHTVALFGEPVFRYGVEQAIRDGWLVDYQHEQETGRFPKILIFAVNDLPHTSHADQLVRICREVFAQGDDFVKKITGNPNVDRPLQRIREFRNRPNPKIVVSVDMLTTGVDIPALEFIVFLRPVKSRILWEQMLGRGTRRCDEINKSKFVVFDCFDGTLLRYFRDVSNFQIEEPRADPLTIPQLVENIWQNIDRDYHVRLLVKRLRRIERDMSGAAREQFARWIPDGDVGRFAGELTKNLSEKFTDTMKLLRNSEFQDLLINYERAKRQFIIAHETQDTVTSRVEERYGQQPSAEDYLATFSAFVQNKADEIDALRILISKPEGWNPDALLTLRARLRENGFDEKTLRRAHERVYRKALADLISMVKHAANSTAPLLTAEERVQVGIAELRAFHTFTPEQDQWLGLIARHLVENLCVDTSDLETQPVFTSKGGLGRARKVFGDQLAPLIERLNYTLAA